MPGLVAGRGHVLVRLRALLERAANSTVRAAVLEGAPGIGKTTVLAALLEEAESLGFSLLGARAEELEQHRNFGTIAEAVRSTVLAPDEEDVLALLDSAVGPDAAFRLVDRLVELVEQRAIRGPVLLWFDDLQWADEWTVRCMGILHRRLARLPLGIVVSTRRLPRAETTATLLSALLDGGLHVDLTPLDDKAVAEVVRDRVGADPSSRLKAALQRAGGNPFFVRELLDAFERDGMLKRSGRRVEVAEGATPAGLLVTVLHRMSSLPPIELELVRVAAVLGGSFTVRDLSIAAGHSEEELLGPVLRLRAEGVLWEEGDFLRFRHDLLREAVYDDLGGPVRNALHARIGHALAADRMDPVQVAHHLVRGARPGDAAAADLMIDAARSGRVTLKESAVLLQRALEVAPGHPAELEVKRWLGTLLHTTDRPAEAVPLLEEVLARTEAPSEQFEVVAALAIAALRSGDRDGRLSWRARARELAKVLEDSEDPAVILEIAQCYFDEADFATAAETAARAIPLARAADDRRREEEAENMTSWLLTGQGLPSRALPHSARALALARGGPSEAMRRLHHAAARRDLWELDTAIAELEAARRIAGESGAVAVQLKATCESASVDYWAGRWDDATLHADTALEMMRELGITSDGAHPLYVRAWIALRHGDLSEAARVREDLVPDPDAPLPGRWIGLLIAAARGPAPEVERLAREIVQGRREWPFTPFGEGALADAARAALRVGDRSTATQAAEVAAQIAAMGDSPSRTLDALRCRAIVQGDPDAAQKAVALADACPWPIEKARALEDAGGVLVDSREQLLDRASAIYEEVGSVLDLTRVAERRGHTQRARRLTSRPVTGWGSLTEAELKVVDLAAEGLTNREIGERLFISHRTVSTHLGHVFDKLQIRSRVELARQAAAREQSRGGATES